MKTLTLWILAGALVASLRMNFMAASAPVGGELQPRAAAEAPACDIDPEALGLSAEQEAALEGMCQTPGDLKLDFEAQAELKMSELREQLGALELDEERLRTLVGEVSDLRRSALNFCVDEVLRVRSILDASQIEVLMQSCCPQTECAVLEGSLD